MRYAQRRDDHLPRFNDTPVQIVSRVEFETSIPSSISYQTFGNTTYYYDISDNVIARIDKTVSGLRYLLYPKRKMTHLSQHQYSL